MKKRFVLFFSDGKTFATKAPHVADALLASGRPLSMAHQFVRFTQNEKMVQVAPDNIRSCQYDLEKVGIYIND